MPAPQNQRPGTPLRTFLLGLVVAAALALLSPTEAAASAGHEPGVQASPPWAGSTIVHARFRDSSGIVYAEEWLNRRTGATHRRRLGPHGKTVIVEPTIAGGSRILRLRGRSSTYAYMSEVIDRRDPWLETTSSLLEPWRMLDNGRAAIIGTGHVNGRPSWTLRLDVAQESDSLFVDSDMLVDVDHDTYLPLRMTVRHGPDTATTVVESDEVPESVLMTSLFETQRPWSVRVTRIPYRELTGVLGFQPYTLGEEYAGLRFGATIFSEKRPNPDAAMQVEPELFLGYVRGNNIYGDPEIVLTEQAARTEDARRRLMAFRAEGREHELTIRGVTRIVYVLDEDRPTVYFAVVVGETLVKGRAPGPAADVLSMLSRLEPTNRLWL